jgi:hypothetical protein
MRMIEFALKAEGAISLGMLKQIFDLRDLCGLNVVMLQGGRRVVNF